MLHSYVTDMAARVTPTIQISYHLLWGTSPTDFSTRGQVPRPPPPPPLSTPMDATEGILFTRESGQGAPFSHLNLPWIAALCMKTCSIAVTHLYWMPSVDVTLDVAETPADKAVIFPRLYFKLKCTPNNNKVRWRMALPVPARSTFFTWQCSLAFHLHGLTARLTKSLTCSFHRFESHPRKRITAHASRPAHWLKHARTRLHSPSPPLSSPSPPRSDSSAAASGADWSVSATSRSDAALARGHASRRVTGEAASYRQLKVGLHECGLWMWLCFGCRGAPKVEGKGQKVEGLNFKFPESQRKRSKQQKVKTAKGRNRRM